MKLRLARRQICPRGVAVISVVCIILVKLVKPACFMLGLFILSSYSCRLTIGTLANSVVNATVGVLAKVFES